MSQPPQQPWDQPPAWVPQQPWTPQQHQQFAPGPPRSPGGGVPLLVLGLVTAVLGLAGTVLPSVEYPGDLGSFGPLLQTIGGTTQFLARGLVLLAAVALLVTGALLQRGRPGVGTGLLLVGAGMVAEGGLAQLFGLLQAAVTDEQNVTPVVGGVLLALAGCTAVATAVVGLVRLSRLR